jgi:hypothetical protein
MQSQVNLKTKQHQGYIKTLHTVPMLTVLEVELQSGKLLNM